MSLIALLISLSGFVADAADAPTPDAQQPTPPAQMTAEEKGMAPTAMPPLAPQKGAIEDADPQALLNIRDPFRPPDSVLIESPRTELEIVSIEELKMLGVMTGPKETRALILTPNGKTHFVRVNDKIGNRRGVIVSITPQSIKVSERIVNVLGKEENVLNEIVLPPEGESVGYTGNRTGAIQEPGE